MGALHCVDGSVLSVEAVSCRDRAGRPYEITLNLARDSVPFAAVGQRCGYQLSELAERISAARHDPDQTAAWPDPDDRFPAPSSGEAPGPASGTRRHPPGRLRAGDTGPLDGYLPGDHEYFTLRSRERVDLPGTGELRCVLRSSAVWVGECMGVGQQSRQGQRLRLGHQAIPGQHAADGQPKVAGQPGVPEQHVERSWRHPAGGQGRWQLTRRAVIEAWGAGGVGVRAVLTSAELVAFLDTVLRGPDSTDAAGEVPTADAQAGGQPAGNQPGGIPVPLWRQRGRVPDGIARSRLPALRAQARGSSGAPGGAPARWSDVRR
jgi:hypothetical protein